MRLAEIGRLGRAHIESCRKQGTFPYLYDAYQRSGEEDVYRLATIVCETLGLLREPKPVVLPAPKLPMKSCLKRKNYVINFDGSLFDEAKKNAMKRVTKKDMERRQEYITKTIKRENELLEVELRFLAQSPQMEQETRVQMSDSPRYLKLIAPVEVLRDGAFTRQQQEMVD